MSMLALACVIIKYVISTMSAALYTAAFTRTHTLKVRLIKLMMRLHSVNIYAMSDIVDSLVATSESAESADSSVADSVSGMGSFISIAGTAIVLLVGLSLVTSLLLELIRDMASNRTESLVPNVMKMIITAVVSILLLGGLSSLKNMLSDVGAENDDASPSAEPTTPTSTEPAPPTSAENTPAPAPDSDATSAIDSSTLLAILLVIVGIVVVSVIVFFIRKEIKARKALRATLYKVQTDIEYADGIISKISAEYAQAHVNPEYALYKPLVISDAKVALEFADELMNARDKIDQFKSWFNDEKSPVRVLANDEHAREIRGTAEELKRSWNKLNADAERVGTPILDHKTLARAEALWSLASNEGATPAEREHAMSKLEDILDECKRELRKNKRLKTIEKSDKKEALDSLRRSLGNFKTKGIIGVPESLQLNTHDSRLALEA